MKLSIDYYYESREIHIPVRVEAGLIWTPPVAVPTGTWKLYWELDEDSGKYLQFCAPGVGKHDATAVPSLKLECKLEEIQPLSCPATVTNTVDHPNGCSLDISFKHHVHGLRFKHDPTIAVTPDPLGCGEPQPGVTEDSVLRPKA